jgi:hypothetical protein
MGDRSKAIDGALDREAEGLVELSHRIHAHPETRFEEVQASAWLASDDVALPHTPAFAHAARSERGDATLLDGASVLAGVAADLLGDGALLERVRNAFTGATGRPPVA